MAGTQKYFKMNILGGTTEESTPVVSKFYSTSFIPLWNKKKSKHVRHPSKAKVLLDIIKENSIGTGTSEVKKRMPSVRDVQIGTVTRKPRTKIRLRCPTPKSYSEPPANRRSGHARHTKCEILEYNPCCKKAGTGEKPGKQLTGNQGSKIEPLWRHFGLDKGVFKIQDCFDSNLRKVGSKKEGSTTLAIPAPTQKKEEFVQHVFVIKGSAMAFKQPSSSGFVNWFNDESDIENSIHESDEILNKFDFSGFSNQEISLKLFSGNRLMIEATRPCRGKFPPKTVKEKIMLPKGSTVDSLHLSRNSTGDIIIRKLSEIEEL